MPTIATHDDFWAAFMELPQNIQRQTKEFIERFRQNPKAPGINLERVHNTYDDKIYSCRINQQYRAIIAKQADTYILLWADTHDEAYEWAVRKKIEVNKLTGIIQLYGIIQTERREVISYLFDRYTDEQLLALGVPQLQLPFIRTLVDNTAFYENQNVFSKDVFELLSWLVKGEDYNEVLALVERPENVSEDFAEALSSERNTRDYAVITDDEELNYILQAPLEKWRVFLHPSQKKVATGEFHGPVRVSGEAGTGKTVVAMHRAKYLLEQGKKVLFTTFTKNLVGDIQRNLQRLLSFQQIGKIEVIGIDSLISSFLMSHGKDFRLIYDVNKLKDYWTSAILNAQLQDRFEIDFLMEEWSSVATEMDSLILDSYLAVARPGRGVRLNRPERMSVWHIFEEYMALLRQDNVRDISYAIFEARKMLAGSNEHPFDSIIVDECQDISSNAFRFLRAYAGPEHDNDLFIVGDVHQRIYKNKAVLSRCGINIRGRSRVLRINYRTTEETRKYAYDYLNGIVFEDNDSDNTEFNKCQSLVHGEYPSEQVFDSVQNMFQFSIDEINSIINSGVEAKDICIVARGHNLLDTIGNELSEQNLNYYRINSDIQDDSTESGVRLATMHRIKGLEFRYVFILLDDNAYLNRIKQPLPRLGGSGLILEKCLMYVALTRAQVKAYVLCVR